jgi:hypothetical protein
MFVALFDRTCIAAINGLSDLILPLRPTLCTVVEFAAMAEAIPLSPPRITDQQKRKKSILTGRKIFASNQGQYQYRPSIVAHESHRPVTSERYHEAREEQYMPTRICRWARAACNGGGEGIKLHEDQSYD